MDVTPLTADDRRSSPPLGWHTMSPESAMSAMQTEAARGLSEAAAAAHEFLLSGNPKALAGARRQFMRAHGRVFWVLGIMQRFWYSSDKRRERFVDICRDKDVQQLTFDSYMHKRLVRKRPMAHVRIFFKDMAHLLGIAKVA